MGILVVGLIFVLFLTEGELSKILSLATVPAHSHSFWITSLTEALAERGHQIISLTPEIKVPKHPNISSIYMDGGYDDVMLNVELDEIPAVEEPTALTKFLFDWFTDMCERLLLSSGNKHFFEKYQKEKFDLILVDASGNECFLKYIHLFNYPPVIAVIPYGSPQWINMAVGNYDNPAYYPNAATPFSDEMSFTERAKNLYVYLHTSFLRWYEYLPTNEAISAKFFNFSAPSVDKLSKNISLALVNSHMILDYPKPSVPGIIPVAGMHIRPPKPLPEKINKFISEATHGVIYFSFGSTLQGNKMSKQKLAAFLEAFSQLKQRVLWKFEADLPEVPSNVMIDKWIPQSDVLAHKNVVLFITHSGLLSTQESIYHGVPMLGIPLMIDQYINANRMVKQKLGLKIKYSDVSDSQQILHYINNILNDPSFKERVKEVSEIFRDQESSPLDRAVYWVEYVLRHKSVVHLKPASLKLTWYQYYLLDIIILVFTIAILISSILYIIIRNISHSPDQAKKKQL